MFGGVFGGVGPLEAVKSGVIIAFVSVLCILAPPSTGTARAEFPSFDGTMTFPAIQDASDSEDYSWKVQLGEDQALELLDDKTAIVYYTENHALALTIFAGLAHDAIGTSVPTTLAVTGDDIITLTVHHRAGNPKAGGAPFDYPVVAGQGWEGGIQPPVIIQGPPDEAELRKRHEREGRSWEWTHRRPKVQAARWYVGRRGLQDGPTASKTLELSVLSGQCLGEPSPRIDHIEVIEKPPTAQRPFKSAVITVFVRSPAPLEVLGTVNPDEPGPACAGVGVALRAKVKLKRLPSKLFLFDGSYSPPRLAVPTPEQATSLASRSCGNTYGGDFILAKRMRCAKARQVVRSWAHRYERSGATDGVVRNFRCHGVDDPIEGLVVSCHKGSKRLSFFANVP